MVKGSVVSEIEGCKGRLQMFEGQTIYHGVFQDILPVIPVDEKFVA
jgi:hypothetical protein